MWKWKWGGIRLRLYLLFLGCLLFQSAIKMEASSVVTVNKTISGRSSRLLRKISFQGSAYQRSWKGFEGLRGPSQTRSHPPHHPAFIPRRLCASPWIRIMVANLPFALNSCHKINKSITFPHTRTHGFHGRGGFKSFRLTCL